jgi:hypothetical protein
VEGKVMGMYMTDWSRKRDELGSEVNIRQATKEELALLEEAVKRRRARVGFPRNSVENGTDKWKKRY